MRPKGSYYYHSLYTRTNFLIYTQCNCSNLEVKLFKEEKHSFK